MPNEHPKKPRQFSDVAWPGRTPASATSKPVLASNRPSHVDQTVNVSHSQQPDLQKIKPRRILLDSDSAPVTETDAEKQPLLIVQKDRGDTLKRQPDDLEATTNEAAEIVPKHATDNLTKSAKKIKPSRSLARKIFIGVLCAAIVGVLIYNAVLVREFLNLHN